jgi:hypothetical protein
MTASINDDNTNILTPAATPMEAASSQDDPLTPRPPETISSTSTVTKTKSLDDIYSNDYALPPCPMPPQSELEVIETFVMSAVMSQHEDAPAAAAVQGYKALIDALRRVEDPEMLRNVLVALRTAGKGNCLRYLTRYPEKHAHLNHLIFKFNSTVPTRKLQADPTKQEACEIFNDGSMLDTHLHLILALVSAKSVSTVPVLTWVWKMMINRAPQPEPM